MKRMKKILSLLLVVMMVISLLPTEALADSLKHELTSEAETVSEGETEKKDTETQEDSMLTEMVFSYSKLSSYHDYEWQLSSKFDPKTKEYTVIIPTKKDTVYLRTQFSEKYPKATAKAEYTQASNINNTIKKDLIAGEGISLVNLVSTGENSNTIKLTVQSNDESNLTEEYTIHVKREESIGALWFKDTVTSKLYLVDGKASLWDHTIKEFQVPDDAVLEIMRADGYNSGSTVEISGAVDGKLVPKWDNGTYEFTVTVTSPNEEVLPVTYTGRLISSSSAAFYIDKAPDKTEYQLGEKFDTTGMVVKYITDGKTEIVDLNNTDVTIEPNRPLNENDKYVTISYKGMSIIQPITVAGISFKGEGTKEKPYLLENADDCVALSKAVSAGKTYADTYFKITDNITLPEGWVPIGSLLEGEEYAPNLSMYLYNYFSGHIDGANPDGGNYLLTIPRGEKTLLGCVTDGSLSNLDIYGERIDGYGIMEYYVVGRQYGVPAIDITNVNLKSGTHTKMSGFLGGYASGSNTVNITNCTIEEGVVIGDDGSWGDELDKTYGYGFVSSVQYNDMVGSFGGAFNGNIVNCVSYATCIWS